MEKLANEPISKVPYDVQGFRENIINEHVEGLSGYYHRLLSLGHDPLLGFFFGVKDIFNGTITTIDKNGKYLTQIAHYSDLDTRKAKDIFVALGKQIAHLKSDVTTSMGLPAPLMGVFNLFQFGSIGEEEMTIAEIAQSMYYEGFDFIHFCSQSIPVMICEAVVRLCYSLKRIKEGNSVKDSISVFISRDEHPKLGTMLFASHTLNVGINAGKVYFKKNPLAINYPEWLMFMKYSFSQIKWVAFIKPEKRMDYINEYFIKELDNILITNMEYTFE